MLQKYQGDKLGNLPDYLIIFQIFTRFSTPIKIFVFKELVRGKVKCGYVEQIPSHKKFFYMVSYAGSQYFSKRKGMFWMEFEMIIV